MTNPNDARREAVELAFSRWFGKSYDDENRWALNALFDAGTAHANSELQARLDAVVGRCEQGIDWEIYEGHETVRDFVNEVHALAQPKGAGDEST